MRPIYSMIFVVLATAIQGAEPKFDPDAAAKTIAPFVDEYTLVVVRVDPWRIELDAFAKLIDPLPVDAESKKVALATAKAWLADYRKKGGREIYLTYGSSDFPNPPCLLTPIAESPSERHDLAELLQMIYGSTPTASAKINGFMCVGTKDALDRLKARKPAARAEVAQAFAACGDSIAQLILVPSAQSRKIFEEVSPTLPKEVGSLPITTFTREMKWAAFSIGTTPKVPVCFVIQTTGEAAVTQIAGVFEKIIAQIELELPKQDENEEDAAVRKLFKLFVTWTKPVVNGPDKDQFLIAQDLEKIIPSIARLTKDVQPGSKRISQNNFKQIGLACFNFADSFGGRFPANILDKAGKPLLSWRVAILPYIEQAALYKQFKLDEPWDSDHNKKLIPMMPKIFFSPFQDSKLNDRTTYLAPLGKGLAWDDPKGAQILSFTDGTSNTILVVESDDEHAVVWTKPDDIAIDPKNPAKGLLGHHKNGFMVLMCDGSVRMVSKSYSAIYAMFTRDGGEVLPEK